MVVCSQCKTQFAGQQESCPSCGTKAERDSDRIEMTVDIERQASESVAETIGKLRSQDATERLEKDGIHPTPTT